MINQMGCMLLGLFCLIPYAFCSGSSKPPSNTSLIADPHYAGDDRLFLTKDLLQINLISKALLPMPHQHILTQTLLTPELEKYYQGSAVIQIIYSETNKETYSRAILMLIDSNKAIINKPPLVEKSRSSRKEGESSMTGVFGGTDLLHKTAVAEFAFITINFKELPQNLIKEVLHTHIPFGTLLLHYNIKTLSINRQYFWILCNEKLAFLTQCQLNNKLYGRMHTLIRENNNKWVAKVTEILV